MLTAVLAVLLLAPPSCHPRRDADGRIVRDPSARAAFRATHPCPRTGKTTGRCYGYTIDHICPLACCGRDDPSNMQWQTNAEAKAKDAWERNCSTCGPVVRAKPVPPESTPEPLFTPATAPAGCCKHCKSGCPCGDSCISCDVECRKPVGCACKGGH